MADDKKFDTFLDLNEWLHSIVGKNALKLDNFTKLNDKYGAQVKIGKQMHNIEKELFSIQQTYAEIGFNNVKIEETRYGTKISFLTSDNSVPTDKCPVIEISSEDGGLMVHNGMVAFNTPVALMNSRNELGFVSEMSLMLARVNKEIRANMSNILTQGSANKRAELVSYYTDKIARSSTEEVAGLYDLKNLYKDTAEFFNKAVLKKRPESVKAQSNQLQYMTAIKQMFENAVKNKKINYETDFKHFTSEMEEVMDLARMTRDINELEKALKFNRARYHNSLKIWDTQLKNFFEPIIKDITQGGMTEGTRGRLGLMEPDTPFNMFASTGKKITQNLQVFEQKSNFAEGKKTIAVGMNKIFTQAQKDLLDEAYNVKNDPKNELKTHKDLYGVMYISEEHIKKARDIIKKRYANNPKLYKKLMLESAKGFGYDASFMTEDFANEMADVLEDRPLKDINIDDVNQIIREKIIKYIKTHKTKGKTEKEKAEIKKEIDEEIKKLDNFSIINLTDKDFKGDGYHRQLRRYLKEAIRSISGVDYKMGTRKNEGKYGSGFFFDYDTDNNKIVNLHTVRNTSPYAWVGRDGATGDARTNQATITNDYRDILAEVVYGKDLDTLSDKEKKELNIDTSEEKNILAISQKMTRNL